MSNKNDSGYFQYRSILSQNRETYLVNNRDLIELFVGCDENFGRMMLLLSEHDRNNKTQVTLVAFVMLMQRQAHVAFNHFSEYQSFQGWVVFRFAIEITLFIGMFIDDKKNFTIWQQKNEDQKKYMQTFQGKNFNPECLRDNGKLRHALKRMNDEYLHVNPNYFYRSIGLQNSTISPLIDLKADYIDDQYESHINSIAMIHLLAFAQETLWDAFLNNFYPNHPLKTLGLADLKQSLQPKVELVSKNPLHKELLQDFGAWDFSKSST